MSSTKTYKLYYLTCPESLEIRYVGVTKQSLSKRLKQHLYKVNRKDRRGQTHKSAWIQSLTEAANKTGARLGDIPRVCRGIRSHSNGYVFSYYVGEAA